jgi:hypothetical protein
MFRQASADGATDPGIGVGDKGNPLIKRNSRGQGRNTHGFENKRQRNTQTIGGMTNCLDKVGDRIRSEVQR